MLSLTTDVRGSCLNVNSDHPNNKAFISYLLNGEIKALVVMDGDRIVARSILRLGWDDSMKVPLLLLEPVYSNINNPILYKAIRDMAIEKARVMGLTLVEKTFPNESDEKEALEQLPPYPGSITFFQGQARFTYSDSANTAYHLGGLKEGKFAIWDCRIIYGTPPVRTLTHRKIVDIRKYSELNEEQQKTTLIAIKSINLATTTDTIHGKNWDEIGYTESIYTQLRKSASARETMYIAQHDEKIVGYVAFYTQSDNLSYLDDLLENNAEAYCSWTAVDDDYRGQGLAIDLKMQIFDDSKFRSFKGHIKKTNAASLRVLSKFKEKGYEIKIQDANDMILYTVTKPKKKT